MKAYIIGTGPGNEELLTLKAVKALKECTAVLYDRLVSNNILNYINEDCKIYYCGKEPGSHYKTQDEINELMIKLASTGHIVGRIKGGDPYVFGRGGEEVIALLNANIDFEVIPGVTSPIAVLSYAGIPITHRNIARSFHIVTGMSTGELNINFKTLAKEDGTLVFMMGLAKLKNIVNRLVENGKDITTPAAVVMKGTSSKQKKVIGTLEDIVKKTSEAKLKSPCIIAIGKVVEFSEDFNWYENKPLFGKNICITRSKNQAFNLKNQLWDLGAEVTEIHSIKIKETKANLDNYIQKFKEYDHIIFTSTNAVNIYFEYLVEKKYDIRKLKAKFSVIGNATKLALESKGIIPFLVADEFYKERLFEMLMPSLTEGQSVLIPTSAKASLFLSEKIKELGIKVDKASIYDTVKGTILNEKSFDEVDIVFFTSPSTVLNMIELVGIESIKSKQSIAIGPKTLKALKENNIEAKMCEKHSEEGFLEEIVKLSNEEV